MEKQIEFTINNEAVSMTVMPQRCSTNSGVISRHK